MTGDPCFTEDWFSHNIPSLQAAMGCLIGRKRFVEIGCFEGRSTCWFLKNGLADDGQIWCIDTFAGSEEHANVDFSGVRSRFCDNTEMVRGPFQSVHLIPIASKYALASLINDEYESSMDFIYIDGSHQAPDVMSDAVMAYHLLAPRGIMVFDDYAWAQGRSLPLLHSPKIAVDMFTSLFYELIGIVSVGHQLVAIKK